MEYRNKRRTDKTRARCSGLWPGLSGARGMGIVDTLCFCSKSQPVKAIINGWGKTKKCFPVQLCVIRKWIVTLTFIRCQFDSLVATISVQVSREENAMSSLISLSKTENVGTSSVF